MSIDKSPRPQYCTNCGVRLSIIRKGPFDPYTGKAMDRYLACDDVRSALYGNACKLLGTRIYTLESYQE